MGRFLIVEFVEENTVAIVPDNWNNSNYCKWPPTNDSEEIKRLVCSFAEPAEDWKTFRVKVLTSSSRYSKLNRKIKIAEVTSDINMTSTDAEEEGGRQQLHSGIIMPSFSPAALKPPSSSALPSYAYIPPSGGGNAPPESNSNTPAVDNNEKSLRKILREIESIKETQRAIVHMIAEMKAGDSVKTAPAIPQNCPKMPIDSAEDLNKLNIFLEQEEHFISLVNYLGSIGGFNMKDITRRILSSIMTNRLSTQYNWRGNGVKLPLSMMSNVTKVVLASVRANSSLRDVTEHDVNQCIKTWLMHAKDRDGGRAKRIKLS